MTTPEKAMVLTVGTGVNGTPDRLASALAWSIDQSEVSTVIFITSAESQMTARKVEECYNALPSPRRVDNAMQWRDRGPIQNIEDTNCIYPHCRAAIQELVEQGISADNIIVNYTSGTKAMSAAAALAGSALDCQLMYISGERENGIVRPGTEKWIPARPRVYQAYHDLNLATLMLQRLQFEATQTLCNNIDDELLAKQDTYYCKQLCQLARAYSAWDKFDHGNAAKKFRHIQQPVEQTAELLISDAVARQLTAFGQESNGRKGYRPELLADLIANADRRTQEGKYDDAIARFYRVTEMLAQLVLWQQFHIDTGNINLDRFDADTRSRLHEITGDVSRVGLEKAYKLLETLGHPAGAAFFQPKSVRDLLQHRNQSILAHGTSPIRRDNQVSRFRTRLLELIQISIPEVSIETCVAELQFPWINSP